MDITVNDLNLALTERCGTPEPLFMAQRSWARSCVRGGSDAEAPAAAACAIFDVIAVITGIPYAVVRAVVIAAHQQGAYVKEVRDEEAAYCAEAMGISIDEARRLYGWE